MRSALLAHLAPPLAVIAAVGTAATLLLARGKVERPADAREPHVRNPFSLRAAQPLLQSALASRRVHDERLR